MELGSYVSFIQEITAPEYQSGFTLKKNKIVLLTADGQEIDMTIDTLENPMLGGTQYEIPFTFSCVGCTL